VSPFGLLAEGRKRGIKEIERNIGTCILRGAYATIAIFVSPFGAFGEKEK